MNSADADLRDYHAAYSAFSLAEVEKQLSGDLHRNVNVCVECCDRHPPADVALLWDNEWGKADRVTFGELRTRAGKFANFLESLGIGRGDRVAGLLPRTPDLLTVVLGTLRTGAVYQPLFTAFGSKAIEHRVRSAETKLIVTDTANRHRLDGVCGLPPVATLADRHLLRPADIDLRRALAEAPAEFQPAVLTGNDPMLMMFTSGTTGLAKGILVPTKALLSFITYLEFGVGVRPADSYWNMADPGWAYGLFFAVIAPLVLGRSTILYDGPFSAESAYRIIAKHRVSVLVGAPTAYRLMMAAGAEAARPVNGYLRVVASGGEPLNPEVIRWFDTHLGAKVGDHYGQTEGGMMVCNHLGLDHAVKLGSAGLPTLGMRIAVLGPSDDELLPGQPGILAVDRTQSPLFWFAGYHQHSPLDARYHRTGDTAVMDADGYITIVGRADDVITSAGYRIGPYDVESALIEHPAVLESAVIGRPDPGRTEVVRAYIVLRLGFEPTDALAAELSLFVKNRLSAHAYPREIEFVRELPKTPSGKVQRYILRQQASEAAPGQNGQ